MRNAARRLRRLALCLPAIAGLAIAGCGAPQFRYAVDSSANTYFKVPHGWHAVNDSSLSVQLSRNGFTDGTPWEVGYDASTAQPASHASSTTVSQPVAQAIVAPLTQAAASAMSYNLLRDFILPVTPTQRRAAAKTGFPLTGFKLYRDSVITPGGGVHGVREIFSYTYPDGHTYIFDQIALTNSNATMVYLLLVHCLDTCYSKNASQIDTVMTSFTVRSP